MNLPITELVASKMLYWCKVSVFAAVIAAFTALLAYLAGQVQTKAPTIRVLYISYSDHAAVKNFLTSSANSVDGTVQALKILEDNSITISRDDLELHSTLNEFHQNNLILECSGTFPLTWKYSGFGEPSVTEENVRIYRDFNDSSTFTYISLLNLMPLSEKTTGQFTCYGASNDTFQFSSSVHLFIPGGATFLIDYDTTVEAKGEDNIFVPCPVTNASANVSLYFKNQIVSSDNPEDLLTFDPKTGFYLKTRFVEEQSEPWGQFYCKVEETKEKSGVITVQPTKGLIVNIVPEASTVILTKPTTDKNNNKLEEKLKFICQAKEEINLKFLRVVIFPTVQYEYNATAQFPYSAYTEVSSKNFRNLSRIYCRTVRNSLDLHSWQVLFSSLPMRSELMEFNYDPSTDEFSCCSPSKKKAKLLLLPCNSISECHIKGQCFQPGRKCSSEDILKLPERSGCARYKLMKENEKTNGGSSETNGEYDNTISLDSGLLQCAIDGKSVERIFFATRYEAENGTVLNTISELLTDFVQGFPSVSFRDLNFSKSQLKIMEIQEVQDLEIGKRRFKCKGPKFFLAVGFIWQTVHANGEIRFYEGRDSIRGSWVHSQLQLSAFPVNKSTSVVRLYCIAPRWSSSNEDWTYAVLKWH